MADPLRGVRAADRRHPLWWDIGLAALVAIGALWAGPVVGSVALCVFVAVHLALVFRRRRPFAALVGAVAGTLLATGDALLTGAPPPWTYLASWVLVFSAAVHDERRRTMVAAVAMVVAVGLSAAVAPSVAAAGPIDQVTRVVAMVGVTTASLLLGLQVRARRHRIAAEQAEIVRAATEAERVRIAREIHDVIGHNLSVISALAAGGDVVVRRSPEDAARVLAAIGDVSRASVQEVRRVLRVLRHNGDPCEASLRPQPGVADISELVESVRRAGRDVELVEAGDLSGLDTGRQRAVYRIVQESLTNVLRHAGAHARVRVSIARDPAAVVVSVSDTGGGGKVAGAPGNGLVGMRERVEAYAGSVCAGPAGSGWLVRARLPLVDDARRAVMT